MLKNSDLFINIAMIIHTFTDSARIRNEKNMRYWHLLTERICKELSYKIKTYCYIGSLVIGIQDQTQKKANDYPGKPQWILPIFFMQGIEHLFTQENEHQTGHEH